MASIVDMLTAKTYTPPPFHLFEKAGYSYAYEMKWSLGFATGEFINAHKWMAAIQDGADELTRFMKHPDLIDMYTFLTKAEDMLFRLYHMEPKDRERHLEFDQTVKHVMEVTIPSLEKLDEEWLKLSGYIKGWEAKDPDLVARELDRQLKDGIDQWEQIVKDGAEFGLDNDDPEQYANVGDCALERDRLEYVRSAIRHAQREPKPRLLGVTYFNEFSRRLDELDPVFEKALRGQRDFNPTADDNFWWHWPPKNKKRKRS